LSFLTYLADSDFSYWLSVSMAGFPTLIALHSVGMAVVVGLSLVISLRLNGLLPDLRPGVVPRLLDDAVWGFTLNFVTGLLLFITRGPEYITSAIFLIKMLLVLVGAALMFWLRQHFRRAARGPQMHARDRLARLVSLSSSVAWFGAVVAGRLIAYLSALYR
jgi:hypothetical protein